MKNPQAFPKLNAEAQSNGDFLYIQEKGMTLLDYFAGQVLVGISNNEDMGQIQKSLTRMRDDSDIDDTMARLCYAIAKAMLKERERRNE